MQTKLKSSNLEALLELAKKQGVQQAEVIQMSWTENPVNFENNKLKALESNESSGIFARVIKNNKIGSSSTTDPQATEKVIKDAIESSDFGPDATFKFSDKKLENKEIDFNKPDLPLEELVEKGTKAIEYLRTFHKDILISGGFNLGFGETTYLNSNGVHSIRKKTMYSTSLYALLVRGEDFLGIYDGNSSLERFPDEKEMSRKIFEKLTFARENTNLTTKKYPVIFTPHAVSGIFGYILSVLLNGKVIQQKISPLYDKLNKQLFDKKLTFIEDPQAGTRKAEFDDEGIKTNQKVLIKEGIINNFYFDLNSASKTNNSLFSSTGNGFKPSLGSPPSPSLTSVQIESGKRNSKDIIKNIKEGVLVDQLLGAGQSNTLAGEFSVGIDLGYKILNGNIQGRIKNCMVAGNIFEVLKNICEISSNREWVGGSELYPYFIFENLTVAGK